MHRSLTLLRRGAAAAAVTLALPGTASAGDATLWACHGPAGQPLGTAGLVAAAAGDAEAATFGSGCSSPVSALGQGGLRAAMTSADPAAGSAASWTVPVPRDVTLTAVRATRRTTGFGGDPVPGSGTRYRATTSGATLEERGADAAASPLDGTLVTAAAGSFVRFGVSCAPGAATCAGTLAAPAGVEIGAVGIGVSDGAPPRGAVGGLVSPAAGTLSLAVRATDAGLGLADARVLVDGVVAGVADLGGADCADLSPGNDAIDLRAGVTCPTSVEDVPLTVDTTALTEGEHRLEVVVRDVAGNATTVADETVRVANTRPSRSATAILNLGGGGGAPGTGTPDPGGPGGAGGATGGQPGTVTCARPRLTVRLAQRPLRRSRGVAVLRRGARYRFTGRLTCLAGGRRVSAPRGTVVEILNVLGRRTLVKNGVSVRARGEITAILAYRSSRLVRFRFRSADGSVAQVSIRVVVSRGGRR